RATGHELGFVDWMKIALPVVGLMLPLIGLWLTRNLKLGVPIKLDAVGAWRSEEWRTLLIFALTAAAWITRTQPFGGWAGLLAEPGGRPPAGANDACVALLAVVLMFLLPNGHGGKLLRWETAAEIPWGVLLLFSSGIVIARAFQASGLSQLIGQRLAYVEHLPTPLLIASICLAVTFLTEVTSNTAMSNLLMPILAATAVAANLEPMVLMVPAAISASFAFMLPVATAPNAVVYSSGRVAIKQMVREGFAL